MRSSPLTRRVRRGSWPLFVERLEGRVVPSFFAARAFDAGSNPDSVAIGDFNGDGIPDLAVANSARLGGSPYSVGVLLGNGDATFQAARHLGAGSRPSSVAVGDVNGDGRLDLYDRA